MDRFWLFCSFVLTLIGLGCTPEPDIEFPDYSSKLVIDGYIEQGQFPKVVLTRSASYFDDVDSVSIRRFIVSTAKVVVSDGENEEVLTYRKSDDFFPPFIYQATELKGEVGKTYTLTVFLEGQVYTSTTTIAPPPLFDSIWYKPSVEDESQLLLYGKLKDPENEANFYRIFTKRAGKDSKYIPVYYSAFADAPFNGKSFTFAMVRGSESLTSVNDDTYFEKGDTVSIKLCSLDEPHFRFWSTLENELYMAGNPFASSGNKAKSNVSDNALGVWGGYGASYYNIILR